MLIYAHRGSSGHQPENTLAGFAQAITDGADGIELDLHATADGVPVVIHDRDLSRTTNGHGQVDAMTLAEIKTLDAGNGETVPTLAEVVELVAGRLHFDLEIKQPGIERHIVSVLRQFPATRWAASSFDWDILRALRQTAPEAEFWLLAMQADEAAFATARELDATAMALFADLVTTDDAKNVRAAGLNLIVWTVNRVPDARRFRDLGAAGLCTDLPAEIRAGLAS